MTNPNVVVIGGVVVDLTFLIPEFPEWKEAVQAKYFSKAPGGKGLNQAIAAGNLGADVSIISAVGDDAFGDMLLGRLEEHSISHEHVDKVEDKQTGVTNVFISAENAQTAYLGYKSVTNSENVTNAVRQAKDTIRNADSVLMTFEVPLEAIKTAIEIGEGVSDPPQFILNPAPPLVRHEFEPGLLQNIQVLATKRWEAQQLVQDQNVTSPSELASRLEQAGPPIVCVTDAEKGCSVAYSKWDETKEFKALGEFTIGTSGAGTAFCGTLGVSLARGKSLKAAVIKANAAAACINEKKDAAPSMPTIDEVTRMLKRDRDYLNEEGVTDKLNIGHTGL